jgi:hypothetical protein
MEPPDAKEESGNVDETVPTYFYWAEVKKNWIEIMDPHIIV